ncbi:MAG TPA: ABC-2 family transporter protein [Chlamydiales bacterium]|nr:ABC-2 family transporter protein [Chlamydiales bacterium]
MKTVSFFIHLLRTSIRASISVRGVFILESLLMIANNLIFFSMWWIFFLKFNDIGGWQINEMAASMAIICGAWGLSQICFGGIRNLGAIIVNGDLDPFMTQPKNLLLHIAGSKSLSKGWGQLMTTVILVVMGGFVSGPKLAIIVCTIVSGSLIFAGFGIMVYSLAFWMGSFESVSKKFLDSLFVFALYPTNIYSGLLQLVMFTLIPAGLIGYVPVELLRNFSWIRMGLLCGSSAGFLALSFLVFRLGLKRYESGNQFGMRL